MTLFAWANRHNSTPLKLLLKMESEPFTPSLYIPGPKWPLLRTCKRESLNSPSAAEQTQSGNKGPSRHSIKNLRSQSYAWAARACIFTSFVLFGSAPVTVDCQKCEHTSLPKYSKCTMCAQQSGAVTLRRP
jgi:hypothetical protein